MSFFYLEKQGAGFYGQTPFQSPKVVRERQYNHHGQKIQAFFEESGPKRVREDLNDNNNKDLDEDDEISKRSKLGQTEKGKQQNDEHQNLGYLPDDIQHQIAIEAAMSKIDPDKPSTFVDVFLVCTLNKKIKDRCKLDERVRVGILNMLREFNASNIFYSLLFGMGDPKFFNDALVYWRDVIINKISTPIHNKLYTVDRAINFNRKTHPFQWLYARKEHMARSYEMEKFETVYDFQSFTGKNQDEFIGESGHPDTDLYFHILANENGNVYEKQNLISSWLKTVWDRIVWLDVATFTTFDPNRDQLLMFKNLHTLEFKGTIADKTFPAAFGRELPSLKRLLLKSTRIHTIPEDCFTTGTFPNLEFFCWQEAMDINSTLTTWLLVNDQYDMPNPPKTQNLPPGFCQLVKLKHLILEGVIHSLPSNIGDLSNTLETLWITASPLRTFPSSFFKLTRLKKLVIKNHNLEGNFITEDFAKFQSLEWLIIRNNVHSRLNKNFSIPLQVTSALKNLVVFDIPELFSIIHSNSIGYQFGPKLFPSFDKLQLFRIAFSPEFQSYPFPYDLFRIPLVQQPVLTTERRISLLISECKILQTEEFRQRLSFQITRFFSERQKLVDAAIEDDEKYDEYENHNIDAESDFSETSLNFFIKF